MWKLISSIEPAQALAGLGLFLFAMLQLEQALEALLGGPFKRLLRRYTQHPLSALGVGVLSTAVLQSSSLVGIMSLALVGAGVITLSSGVGVILGANLGTTMTGWLVTLIGFKLNLESSALPLVALGSIGLMMLRRWPRLSHLMRLILALGLLLWALGMMKSAVQPEQGSLDQLLSHGGGWWHFFLIGMAVTAVIQSSSAMMMITLSMLAAGLLELSQAAAVVVGADLGTTGTVLLGALGGSAPRRRVAFAHLWFNVINAVMALLMIPFLPWLVSSLGITDPLVALVGFHSSFNLLGIVAFYPFLRRYAQWLELHVRDTPKTRTRYLKADALAVAEAGSEALHKEAGRVVAVSLARYRRVFNPVQDESNESGLNTERQGLNHDLQQAALRYDDLKSLEQEVIAQANLFQRNALTPAQAQQLQADLSAIRNAVHAAKCLKDIQHNLDALAQSDEPALQALWSELRESGHTLVEPLLSQYLGRAAPVAGESLSDSSQELKQSCESNHDRIHRLIFGLTVRSPDEELQLPSLLNMNRELLMAQRDLIQAMQSWISPPQVSS